MSSKTVCCRLCLAMDVPMHLLTGSPLQEVYEKLTNVPLNKGHRPVIACYICYYQLGRCHNLMVKSIKADKLLTQILQSGDMLLEESISVIDRDAYQLDNMLIITPVEIHAFSDNEDNFYEVEIKKDPLGERDEVETDRPLFVECLEFQKPERKEDIERTIQSDVDVKMEQLTEREDIEIATLDDAVHIESEVLTDGEQKKLNEQEPQVAEDDQSQSTDAVPTKKRKKKRTKIECAELTSEKKKILDYKKELPELRVRIVTLSEQGYGIREISRELNISRNTVRTWIRRHAKDGILEDKRRHNHGVRRITDQQKADMQKHYEENPLTPARHFATRYDVCAQTIRNNLHGTGLYPKQMPSKLEN